MRQKEETMSRDQVRFRNGLLLIVTGSGWKAAISPDEIEAIRGRNEGGSVVHTKNGKRPILLDLPLSAVLAELEGAGHHVAT